MKYLTLFSLVFLFQVSTYADYGDDSEVTKATQNTDDDDYNSIDEAQAALGADSVDITITPEVQVAGPGGSSCHCDGVASYYALDGSKTASGQIFHSYLSTAASKCLPMGTRVRVCRVSNPGQCVTVTINDRGPFVAGRTLDLSKSAGFKIGLKGPGHAKVTCHF